MTEVVQKSPTQLNGIERLRDPNYLPGFDEVRRTIGAYLLSRYDTNVDAYKNDRDVFHPLPYPLELGKFGIFEVLNTEYINHLSVYLTGRSKELQASGGEAKIVEVGAAMGRLTHFVLDRVAATGSGPLDMVATDRLPKLYEIAEPYTVEAEDYRVALQRRPQIVVSSWMPPGEDWTPDFRKAPSVQEYLMIGQPGVCGERQSWGTENGQVIDGFQRVDMTSLSQLQIGYIDDLYPYDFAGQVDPADGRNQMSRTISFRRI